MYGSKKAVSDDVDRTAFRKAEKQYKLYYDQNSKKKKQPKQVDLSEVLDFKSISNSYHQNGELPPGIAVVDCSFNRPVFGLESRPGFYFLPGVLSVDEQCRWIRESLMSFPQPPNRTNHNAIYGPISDLFIAAKERKVLVEDENTPARLDSGSNGCVGNGDAHRWRFCEEDSVPSIGKTCKSVPAPVLLRKLRWSTLGLQFDWSKRNYNVSLPHNKIPDGLCQLAKKMAAPAMPMGEEFQPEGAIVNYFASGCAIVTRSSQTYTAETVKQACQGDTLGGHLDDMEADWSKPIVSMSLGCKAIFLLGGKSKDDPPLAMFLRSGDVVLMAGEARECFHGVPRIFADKENAEITTLESRFCDENDFLEYIRTSRININIRQVF